MKRKVGLVLGGGGAKGAYQIGVYKALREYKQIEQIVAFSGTSIGALNLVLLSSKEIDKAERIWLNLSRKNILTLKNWKEYLSFKNFSVLSRRGMLEIFSSDIDFDKVSKCEYPLYVGATNTIEDCGEIFKLNGMESNKIIDCLSASSAIPKIFAQVFINGKKYCDGFRYLNVPIQCLIEEKCNFLFTIPLSPYLAPKDGDFPDTTIIDFNEKIFANLKTWEGTLGFDAKIVEERMNLGYKNAMKLLEFLRKEGVITVTFKDKVRYFFGKITGRNKKFKKYYSMEDVNIIKELPKPNDEVEQTIEEGSTTDGTKTS